MATAEQRRQLSDGLIAALVALLRTLRSWRDDDAARFLRQAVPLVTAGQMSLAELVSQSVAAQAQAATGVPVAPVAVPVATVTALRGVDPSEVYFRPFVQIWSALKRGVRLTEAVDLGAARLAEIAEADMQLAFAHANQQAMQRLPSNLRPRYWRRVLTGDYSCAMCVIASTNRYQVEELNPIHPNCDCGVEADWSNTRWREGDTALLERAHRAASELSGESDRGGRAPDYRKLLVQHGELGPMLVRSQDRFTGPGALPSTN